MSKSAARQWAGEGIAVNLIGIPLGLAAPEIGEFAEHLTMAACPNVDLTPLVVTAITFLLSTGAALTGATITVDGGAVMLP
ncbi:MAG: hypothetical protein JO191_04705 [Mycobacteriaceae bacterium]|nr:hypothetical protein [Mycobacteriaceae bacterium]